VRIGTPLTQGDFDEKEPERSADGAGRSGAGTGVLLPKPATVISNHSARKIGKRSVRFGISAYIEVWLKKPQRNFGGVFE